MNRGDRRKPIFWDDADRQRFWETLGEVSVRREWQVHAYCLMSNHFHLVVETPEPTLVTAAWIAERFSSTIELTDAGGKWRPNWKLTWPARVRSSDFVRHRHFAFTSGVNRMPMSPDLTVSGCPDATQNLSGSCVLTVLLRLLQFDGHRSGANFNEKTYETNFDSRFQASTEV